MARNAISSTMTVPLIVMTPASAARNRISRCPFDLFGYVGQEDETEGQVDEVHGFDESDDREEPGDHPSLRFGLAGDTADEGVPSEAVTEGRADRAQSDGEAEGDQCPSERNTVVCHETLLVVFVFETLAGRAKVDDRQQHEDERLDEADEDDIEGLPND